MQWRSSFPLRMRPRRWRNRNRLSASDAARPSSTSDLPRNSIVADRHALGTGKRSPKWARSFHHGIEQGLPLEAELVGNAYESDKPEVPKTLHAARDAFASSKVALEAFGQDVVDHYLHMADVEVAAFDAAVTDWERARGFERL